MVTHFNMVSETRDASHYECMHNFCEEYPRITAVFNVSLLENIYQQSYLTLYF
jgi:hypothetical protein